MQLFTLLLASAATSVVAGQSSLAPWQVTSLSSFSPSGRPGSQPNWSIRTNITNADPTLTSPDEAGSKVFCQLVWQGSAPYGQILPCDIVADDGSIATSSSWRWTAEYQETSDESPWPTTNFEFRWRATAANASSDAGDVQIWTGLAHFKVGTNMKGTCAASGFCSWGLKTSPVLIDVTTLSCHGSVEEALSGVNCD